MASTEEQKKAILPFLQVCSLYLAHPGFFPRQLAFLPHPVHLSSLPCRELMRSTKWTQWSPTTAECTQSSR